MDPDANASSARLKKAYKAWGKNDPRIGEKPSYKAFLRWLSTSGSSFQDAAIRILEGKK